MAGNSKPIKKVPAHLHRLVHEPADLERMRLCERPAKHRKVLAEHKHRAAVDAAAARHHAVTCKQK